MFNRLFGRPRPRTLQFGNGKQAKILEVLPGAKPSDAITHLGLPPYKASIVVHSGAAGMEETDFKKLHNLLADGLATFAHDHNVLLIDGATDIGAAKTIGETRSVRSFKFPLLGITVSGGITYPGGPRPGHERFPLEENHTHFLILRAARFGDESGLIVGAATAFNIPHLAMIINGGDIVKEEALMHTRQGTPLVVLKGSGRFADELAETTPLTYPKGAVIKVFDSEQQSPQDLYNLLKDMLIKP
ncbi:MAG: hypothetical protein L0154_26310 [Chloroflexi bacterium]|nr:hypothetical protein [Chloroflexota bacterium]